MPFTEEEKRERKNARQREYAKRTGYEANKKYAEAHKDNAVVIPIKLYKSKDSEMLEFLGTFSNRSGYIKDLIRADMLKRKENG